MGQYIGLDVSMKETAISIRQDGKRIWRGKCASDPQLLAAVIRKRAPHVQRVVFETGPLSVWFYHAFVAEGLPAICIDARHAKAALDMAANKTDANDADGLAHLAEVGFYREVRVKGFDSMLIRTLVSARRQLLKMRVQISNQIRGSKAYRNIPTGESDESSIEVIWVQDPRHPLCGRSFRVLRRSTHHGGNFPLSYEVEHRSGSTLLIPVAATEKYVQDANQTKLSIEAVRDLITVAECLESHEYRPKQAVGDAVASFAASNHRRRRRGSGGGVS